MNDGREYSEEEKINLKKQEIERETSLSAREAEAYAFRILTDLSNHEIADEMSIQVGNLNGKLGLIRSKIREAERTAELQL